MLGRRGVPWHPSGCPNLNGGFRRQLQGPPPSTLACVPRPGLTQADGAPQLLPESEPLPMPGH